MSENKLIELNALLYDLTGELISKGYEPFAIAATYSMISMQIYKTTMSDQEYNSMMDYISNNRGKIQKLDNKHNPNSLH